jgi:hypothetical protein
MRLKELPSNRYCVCFQLFDVDCLGNMHQYLVLFGDFKFCSFVYFESHEQFFSYLATVNITGDRAANLDLCLALTAFSNEGSFTCHTYLF